MHKKVFWRGTHRCRTPDQTLAAIGPLLAGFDITRLADLTGLDTLGVPVVQAVRPTGASLSVAQGKGPTLAAAACSAAMEAVETWHAEFAVPAAAGQDRLPAAVLQPGYPVRDLISQPGSLVTEHTVLEWIPAVTMSGTPAMVPRELVRLGRRTAREWRCHLLTADSNGLASGNTRAEAIAHGLHELMGRDACAGDIRPGYEDRAAAVADAAGISIGHLDPGQAAYWLTAGERAGLPGGEQLARVLVRAVPQDLTAPVWLISAAEADQLLNPDLPSASIAAAAIRLNEEIAVTGPQGTRWHLLPSLLAAHLAGLWDTSQDGEDLTAAARDRGFPSADAAIQAARLFYLLAAEITVSPG